MSFDPTAEMPAYRARRAGKRWEVYHVATGVGVAFEPSERAARRRAKRMPRELTARAMNGVGGARQQLSSHDIPRKLRYALRGRCPACRTEKLVEKGVFNVCRKCGLRIEGGPLERARAEIQRRKAE